MKRVLSSAAPLLAAGWLCMASAPAAWAATADGAAAPAKLPLGVSPILYQLSLPKEGPPRPAEVALGEMLFKDKRLSADDTVACSTCHDPEKGFVDNKPKAEGIRSQRGQRNSPTVLNALFNVTQFWDGRAGTLEDQAKLPILNPIEMGQKSPDAVVAKLAGLPEYARLFQSVFGRPVSYDDLARAIAAYERTQYSGDAPFDHFLTGDEHALSAAAKRGWALFNGKGRCNECHAGNAVSPLFSDQKFHNIGIAAHVDNFPALAQEALSVVRTGDEKRIDELALGSKFSELGRFLVTKHPSDVGAFKTPTLRNVAVTGPYMHDGSLATLFDVMDHYNKGGVPNPFLDGGMQRLNLDEGQIDDLVAFLESLTSSRYAALAKRAMAAQRAHKNLRPQRELAAVSGQKGDLGDPNPTPDLGTKNPADVGVYGRYPGAR